MSELTRCNFCSLNSIKARANDIGKIVEMTPNKKYGGVDVFVRFPGEELNRDKHFVAWFMELTDYCAC